MSNTNTITFRIGEETRPVLETENLHESIFSELYQKAFAEIDNYIGKAKEIKENEKDGYIYEGVNNIFAFIGERGAGKTSCMMSVAKALEHKDKNLSKINGLENIKQTTFFNSVLIDPSFFDQKNNILSLIIAHLFQTFRDQASKKDCKNDEEKRRTLIACFEKVQKNLNHLFPKENSLSTDTLEGLVNFSAAIDLQKNIKALIDAYLNFMSNEDKVKFLVLMIDDIDLHTQHAREMVEQIRKYFIQPNVVVLMAVKIDQLSHVIKNGLAEEYKSLIKSEKMSFDLINEMVERYLGKLLPHNHRIYLPDASVYFHSKLKISFFNEKEKDKDYPSVREGVLALIFEKTRYLFYNTIDTTTYIIPRNLRELRQIIALLAEMDTFRDSEKESKPEQNKEWLKAREYNQTLFLRYFMETWCVNNLTEKALSYIHEIFKIADSLLINKSILKFINAYFEEYIGDESNRKIDKDEFFRILKPQNKTYNISLGDVMFILNELLSVLNSEKDRNFIYAIKAFYSFKLYDYYNQLGDYNIEKDKVISKKNSLGQFTNLEKLISGSYIDAMSNDVIDTKLIKVIKKKKFKKEEIDEVIVDNLTQYINEKNFDDMLIYYHSCLRGAKTNGEIISNSLYSAYFDYVDDANLLNNVMALKSKNNENSIVDIFTEIKNSYINKRRSRTKTIIDLSCIKKHALRSDRSLALIEMILTLISKRSNTDNERGYREKDEIRFNSNLKEPNQKNVLFDLYTPFVNLLDLKKCYIRFAFVDSDVSDDPIDIFKLSLRSKNSLIAKLYDKLKNEKSESKEYIEDFENVRLMYEVLPASNITEYIKYFDKYNIDKYGYKKSLNITAEDLDIILEKIYELIKPSLNSWVTIRNVEILDALIVEINNSKDSLRASNGDELTAYKKYFDLVSQFSMDAYIPSADASNKKYEINLNYMSVYSDIISEELNKREADNTYKSLFEEIFPTSVTEKVYDTLYS